MVSTKTSRTVTSIYNKMKEGDTMVELDQFKYTLSTFEKPLVEVRDSL